MRIFALVALLVAMPARAALLDNAKYLVYLGPEVYRSSLFFTDKARVRPFLGGQVTLPDGIVVLAEGTDESIPYGPDRLERFETVVGLGYHLTDRLVLALQLGSESSSYSNYTSATSVGYGAQARYLIPIGHESNFKILTILGFQYYDGVSLERDHSVPVSNTPAQVAICTFFTLGFADCSGGSITVREFATFPASREWYLGAGIGYAF